MDGVNNDTLRHSKVKFNETSTFMPRTSLNMSKSQKDITLNLNHTKTSM
jgi:hypothetical protein